MFPIIATTMKNNAKLATAISALLLNVPSDELIPAQIRSSGTSLLYKSVDRDRVKVCVLDFGSEGLVKGSFMTYV